MRAPLGEGRVLAVSRRFRFDLSGLPIAYATPAGLDSLRVFNSLLPRLPYRYLKTGAAGERLAVMERTSDGFEIAEKDLELRGPGAVFGPQQHGLSDLQFLAEILRAPGLIEAARAEARALVSAGAEGHSEAEELLASLGDRWTERLALARVG